MPEVPNQRRPNIVFVLTDDQGYGDLGCHGNPYIATPHLDALHGESVRFTDYHVGPTCAPTRAGLLTGHFANSTGVWHTIGGRSLLRRGERTLAAILRDAGYATGLFGKWHLGDAPPYWPEERGFDEVVTHGGGGVGNTPDYWNNNYTDDHYRHNGTWTAYEGYCTDVWFREATRFIEHHQARPFFCLLTPNAPHAPFIAPEHYIRPYRELAARDPVAARFFNAGASDRMLRFYGMIACIDENVGRLRARLRELHLDRDTIFIFMTDNGSAGGLVTDAARFVVHGYNAGMRGGKATPYEGGHRVPFFLHWPAGNLDRGRDVPQLTSHVDVLPTLAELCGVNDPAVGQVHGRNLVPLVQGEAESWPERAIVTDSQRLVQPVKWRLSSVMRDRWRLINGAALYDLARDPEQRHDVAGENPALVMRLRDDYEAWWQLVSQQMDEEVPIPLGANDEAVLLTAHDWRRVPGADEEYGIDDYRDNTHCAWNQALVRQGIEYTGYWEVEVAQPGTYRFELRRWPREADLPLAAGIPGPLKPYDETIADGYGGGRALPIEQAELRIGAHRQAQALGPQEHAAVFELRLPAGPAHLETTLRGPDDLQVSAYYVYVERLEPVEPSSTARVER